MSAHNVSREKMRVYMHNVQIGLEALMIRQYLITDGTCQLGNVIVRMLLDNRQKVRVLVNPEDSMEALEGLPIEICYGSVLVKDSMKEFYALPDPRSAILIHTAEKVSISVQRDPSIHRINVQGTINVTGYVCQDEDWSTHLHWRGQCNSLCEQWETRSGD